MSLLEGRGAPLAKDFLLALKPTQTKDRQAISCRNRIQSTPRSELESFCVPGRTRKTLAPRDVLQLLHKYGYERGAQARIARALRVSQTTVYRDIKAECKSRFYAVFTCSLLAIEFSPIGGSPTGGFSAGGTGGSSAGGLGLGGSRRAGSSGTGSRFGGSSVGGSFRGFMLALKQ